jgi:hypothetical protein
MQIAVRLSGVAGLETLSSLQSFDLSKQLDQHILNLAKIVRTSHAQTLECSSEHILLLVWNVIVHIVLGTLSY